MSEQESELEPRPDLGALLLRSVEEFNAWRMAHLDAPIDLRGYDLRGADLRHAFLVGAQLDGAQLDDAALTGAALSGASLKGALLRRADLRRGLFGRAELMDAKLAFSALGRSLPKQLGRFVLVRVDWPLALPRSIPTMAETGACFGGDA